MPALKTHLIQILMGALVLSMSTLTTTPGKALASNNAKNSLSESIDKIEHEINEGKLFNPAIKFRIHIDSDQLVISTFRHPRANQTDIKIDALLIAHAAIKVQAKQIRSVSVYFFNSKDNSSYNLAQIDKNLFNCLHTNSLTKEEALADVKLTSANLTNPISKYSLSSYKEITSTLPLSLGPMEPERRALLVRIKNLKQAGVDVSSLERLFLQLDDSIRLDDKNNGIKPLYIYTLEMLENKEKKRISALPEDNE